VKNRRTTAWIFALLLTVTALTACADVSREQQNSAESSVSVEKTADNSAGESTESTENSAGESTESTENSTKESTGSTEESTEMQSTSGTEVQSETEPEADLESRSASIAETQTEQKFIIFDDQVINGFITDADTSVIKPYMKKYTYKGDYSDILSDDSRFYGLWYDPNMDETLYITANGAEVYIPYLDEYGITDDFGSAFQYELIDRTARGKCPELAIYINGPDKGPLAYYIGGITDKLFWTYDKSQIFYRQEIPQQ